MPQRLARALIAIFRSEQSVCIRRATASFAFIAPHPSTDIRTYSLMACAIYRVGYIQNHAEGEENAKKMFTWLWYWGNRILLKYFLQAGLRLFTGPSTILSIKQGG